MRSVRASALILTALLAFDSATPRWSPAQVHRAPPGRGAAALTPIADSLPSTPLVRTDPRTGSPHALGARRLMLDGALDLAWTPDSGEAGLDSVAIIRLPSASDGAGGRFCAWADARGGDHDIYVQRFRTSGEASPDWPEAGLVACSAPGTQHHLDLASDGAGGVYIVWEDLRGAEGGDIYLLRLNGEGQPTPGWPIGGQAICAATGHQGVPRIAADHEGGAFVVWQDRRNGTSQVYAARVSPSGETAPGWPGEGASLGAEEGVSPSIASTGDGVIVAVWQRDGVNGGRELVAARLDGWTPDTGTQPPALTLSSGATEFGSAATATTESGLLVAWSEWRDEGSSLRVQRVSFAPVLAAVWQAGGVEVCTGEVGRNAPTLSSFGAGDALIAWQDLRHPAQSEVYAQRLGLGGELAPGWLPGGTALCAAAGDQYSPMLAAVDSVSAIVTWEDAAAASDQMLLAAAASGGPAPRLLRASARPGHATIVWSASASGYPSFTASRRIEGGEWQPLATLALDDSLHVVLDDRGAPEGALVSYRLGVASPVTELFYEEVALEIPRAPLVLSLHSARAVRGERGIRVAFALPRGSDARLELMDVAGRRMTTQPLAGLEPGEHQVQFALSGRIAAGVYFVRLIQAREARTAKVIYLR